MAAQLFEHRGYRRAAFHVLLPAVRWEVEAAVWPAWRGRDEDKWVSSLIGRTGAEAVIQSNMLTKVTTKCKWYMRLWDEEEEEEKNMLVVVCDDDDDDVWAEFIWQVFTDVLSFFAWCNVMLLFASKMVRGVKLFWRESYKRDKLDRTGLIMTHLWILKTLFIKHLKKFDCCLFGCK